MSDIPEQIILHGRETPAPQQVPLRAGALNMVFDNGDLRRLMFGSREVINRIYVAVRDPNWRTIPAIISDLKLEPGQKSFHITYNARHIQDPIDFEWSATIIGHASGAVDFKMVGKCNGAFAANRIGICVLHSAQELAGRRCTVEKTDGSEEKSRFPRLIAPNLAFDEVAGIAHEAEKNVEAQVRFAGDVFETEDQRNWGDSSFKTYSTARQAEKPVKFGDGETVDQDVSVSLRGDVGAFAPMSNTGSVWFAMAKGEPAVLPPVGLCVAGDGQPLAADAVARLEKLNLSHLRVDLRLDEPYFDKLSVAMSQAKALSIPLEIALTVTDAAEDELSAFAALSEEVRVRTARYLLLHPTREVVNPELVDLARKHLSSDFELYIGSKGDFVSLNRARPDVGRVDGVCWGFSPQAHARDDLSVMENAVTGTDQANSAARFAAHRGLAATPIAFLHAAPSGAATELPRDVDPRQMSLMGAAWTLAVVKAFAKAGAPASLTFHETAGWRGVMERDVPAALSSLFPAKANDVFPMYHIFNWLGEFARGNILATTSSDPRRVDGMALELSGKTCILLANLTPHPQVVEISQLNGPASVFILDARNAEEAMESMGLLPGPSGESGQMKPVNGALRMSLLPYAVVRVDSTFSIPGEAAAVFRRGG